LRLLQQRHHARFQVCIAHEVQSGGIGGILSPCACYSSRLRPVQVNACVARAAYAAAVLGSCLKPFSFS